MSFFVFQVDAEASSEGVRVSLRVLLERLDACVLAEAAEAGAAFLSLEVTPDRGPLPTCRLSLTVHLHTPIVLTTTLTV